MIIINDIRNYGPIEIQLCKSNKSNFPKLIAEQGHGEKRTRFFEVWDACGIADGCLEAFTSYKTAKNSVSAIWQTQKEPLQSVPSFPGIGLPMSALRKP